MDKSPIATTLQDVFKYNTGNKTVLDKIINLVDGELQKKNEENQAKHAAYVAKLGGTVVTQAHEPSSSSVKTNLAAVPSLEKPASQESSPVTVDINLSSEIEGLLAHLQFIADQTTKDRVVLSMAIDGSHTEEISEALVKHPDYMHLKKEYDLFRKIVEILNTIKLDAIKETVIEGAVKESTYPEVLKAALLNNYVKVS